MRSPKLAGSMIALALLLMQYWIIKRLFMDIVSFPIFWLKTH